MLKACPKTGIAGVDGVACQPVLGLARGAIAVRRAPATLAGLAMLLASAALWGAPPASRPTIASKAAAGRKSAATQKKADGDESRPRPIDTSTFHILLVRDPAVQRELQFSPEQKQQLEEALGQIDRPLFALRDAKESNRREKVAGLLGQLASRLTEILDERQGQRLREIVVQAQGAAALATPTVVDELQLSPNQARRIEEILADTKRASETLGQKAAQGEKADKLAEIQDAGGKKMLAVLSLQQRQRFAALAGDRFDLARLRPLAYNAPELTGIDAWLNSEPLTLAELRGKVVALNFFAYG